MNLREHDQLVELHQDEAQALAHALNLYLYNLNLKSGRRPLYLEEALSIKISTRLHKRLQVLLAGSWPRGPLRRFRPRRWRLEYDEVLQLNALFVAEQLYAAQPAHRGPLTTILGKVNQRALNLNQFFHLAYLNCDPFW